MHSRSAASEGYLQKALALDPNHPMANASLAMLRVREGKVEEARKNLERAVTANSQNYLIHYYYAYALSQRRDEWIANDFRLFAGESDEDAGGVTACNFTAAGFS